MTDGKSKSVWKRPLLWVLVSVMIVLGLVGWYTLASVTQWRNLTVQAVETHDRSKKQIITAMKTEDIPIEQRVALLHSITAMGDENCKLAKVYNWQLNIASGAKAQREQCLKVVGRSIQLVRETKAVQRYLQTEAAAASILKELSVKNALKENIWQREYKNVQAKAQLLTQMEVHDEYAVTYKETTDRVDYLLEAWRSVIEAGKDEDMDDFNKATDTLSHAYKGLTNISSTSQKELTVLLKALNRQLNQ